MTNSKETGADSRKKLCAEWIAPRGRGNYTRHRCTKTAVDAGYCQRHADAHKRAMVKLAAYSGQLKYRSAP